jgi:hypothetical protein
MARGEHFDQSREDLSVSVILVRNLGNLLCCVPFLYALSTHEDVWGSGPTSLPFLTSELEGGEWSASPLRPL